MRATKLLEAGAIAPDFELPVLVGGVKGKLHLKDYLAKQNIVLAFYPQNWETASADQMVSYQVEHEQFRAHDAEVIGICVDSIMNTTVWEREIGPFDFPLCSDFWPHGEVASNYGVLRQDNPSRGTSDRAIFVIGKDGKIRFSRIYSLDQAPSAAEMFEALRSLLGEHKIR